MDADGNEDLFICALLEQLLAYQVLIDVERIALFEDKSIEQLDHLSYSFPVSFLAFVSVFGQELIEDAAHQVAILTQWIILDQGKNVLVIAKGLNQQFLSSEVESDIRHVLFEELIADVLIVVVILAEEEEDLVR